MRGQFNSLTLVYVGAGVLAGALSGGGRGRPAAWSAQGAACTMAGYKETPGLSAAGDRDGVSVIWDGDKDQEARLRLTINHGVPTIQEVAVRRKGARGAM